MALIKCVECGNYVSDKATCCPKCGREVNPVSYDKYEKRSSICKECGQEMDAATGICLNCGFDSARVEQKKRKAKKKIGLIVSLVTAVVILASGIMFAQKANKGNSYILAACKELVDEENGFPDVTNIYYSEKIAEDSTIDYIYRVYIEYRGSWGTESVIYIVDKKGNTYFITAYMDENLSCYLTIAKNEINGFEGLFEPSGDWEKLSLSEVEKYEKKLK